jgi:hypothetical protein
MGILIILFPDALETALLTSGILPTALANDGLFTENGKR